MRGSKGYSKYDGKFEIGQKFNKLTVVDNKIIIDRESKIKVRCECGNEKLISVLGLTLGRFVTCGCQRRKSGFNNHNWRGSKYISNTFIRQLKKNAEMKGIKYLVTNEYLDSLLEKQNFKCSVTGMSIDKHSMSLDRIDSSIGYIIENIRWVHKDINIMKNSFSDEYFRYLCKLVSGIKPNSEVERHKVRRVIRKVKLIDTNGESYHFKSSDEAKQFIDSFNTKHGLYGPARISTSGLLRNKKSKGWELAYE